MTMFKQSGQTPRQQGQNADQGKQAQQIQQQFDVNHQNASQQNTTNHQWRPNNNKGMGREPRPHSAVGQTPYQFRRQQPMVLEGGFAGTPQASNQLPGTFPNLSEAFDDGVNIPTEFFNTENFGTVAVPPLGATGATGAGTSTGPTNLTNSMAADAQFTISSDDDGFDDLGELDLPADFEDDIDMESKDLPMTQHISEGNIYGFMTQDQASQRASVHRNPPMDPTRSASSAALLAVEEENHRIKMQLEEMTKEIEVVRKEAQRKAGENSILKENGEKAARELRAANDKLRETEMTAAQEISKMRELHNKEMKNQQMAHQFDLFQTTSSKTSGAVKVSELPKHSTPQQSHSVDMHSIFPQFDAKPPSRASSVKPKSKDDWVSVQNFASSSKSQRSTKQGGGSNSTFERGLPSTQTPGPGMSNSSGLRSVSLLDHLNGSTSMTLAKNIYSVASKLPTPAPENKIRNLLLGCIGEPFGLRQLIGLKTDESGVKPLPGSIQFEKNTKLEALSQRCVQVLTGLTLHVHEDAIVKSLAVTTSLLQRSIKLRKPLHTGNALRILRILYTQYSSVAKQVCKGSVPFLEMATEDPLEATLAWDKLPSALACIYYLLITRFAQCWPSAAADLGVPDSQAQWGPTSPKCLITFVKVPANARIRSSWISMDTQNPLNHKHFAAFDEDIFALVENIIRDQLRSGLSGKVVPLAHWRVFDNVLLLHRKNISTVCRTLSVLEIISQDPDSCHFYCGWSKRGLKWTNSFKQLETLAEIMNLSSQNDSELANGHISRIKIGVLSIMDRAIRVNAEQTRRIARESTVVSLVVRALREQVELCERIKVNRSESKEWKMHDEGFRTNDVPEFKPSIFHDQWNPLTNSLAVTSPQPKSFGSHSSSSARLLCSLKTFATDKQRIAMTVPGIEQDYMVLMRSLMVFVQNLLKYLPEHGKWMQHNQPKEHASLAIALGIIAVRDLGLSSGAAELAGEVLMDIFSSDKQESELLDLLTEWEPERDTAVEACW